MWYNSRFPRLFIGSLKYIWTLEKLMAVSCWKFCSLKPFWPEILCSCEHQCTKVCSPWIAVHEPNRKCDRVRSVTERNLFLRRRSAQWILGCFRFFTYIYNLFDRLLAFTLNCSKLNEWSGSNFYSFNGLDLGRYHTP